MKFENINIETDRLRIRPLTEKDVEELFAIYSDAETMKFWSCLPYTDVSQSREQVERAMASFQKGEAVELAVIHKEEDRFIGKLSIFNIHEPSQRAEVGYILSRSVWKQGFMREAMTALIQYAFGSLHLRRLEADIDPENKASAALLQKLGFEKEGLLRQRWNVAGKITDSEIYGLLRPADNH